MKKEKKLSNRGFTLIEVLAVIVILVIIVSIAIPNISASLDRQVCKTTGNKTKIIESAAELYTSDHRNTVNKKLNNGKCRIYTDKLLETKDIVKDNLLDGNNNEFTGYVVYNQNTETYTFCFNEGKDTCLFNDDKKDDDDVKICTDAYVAETSTCY